MKQISKKNETNIIYFKRNEML